MDKKAKIKEIERQRQKRKRRLIVRNLSFKASEDDVKTIFSKYGKVVNVTIPLMENKKKRGFAFVEFERFNSLVKAMKELNYTEILGRAIAIDYAVDKTKYIQKMQAIKAENDSTNDCKILTESEIKTEEESDSERSENEGSDANSEEHISESEKRVKNFFREFDGESARNEDIAEVESESSDADSDKEESEDDIKDEDDKDEQSEEEQDGQHEDGKQSDNSYKKASNDVDEGKTVFMRNVSFVTDEESLQELMREYGDFNYCLLCIDKLTDHPKGTAFIKFKNKEDAEKLIEKANGEPGIFLDSRRLQCSYAISRDTLQKQQIEKKAKQPKDKRNLHLQKVGLITPNTREAEGVSQTDMKKRAQIEMTIKQKLRNTNFFISDKRLVIHNLPTNFTDADLRKILKLVSSPKAVITEVRVMKDFKKIDNKGLAASKGFSFVSFSRHEDALIALKKLNNNPNIFTPQKRPIVEFSIENKMALLSKEKRAEKSRMLNKRKADTELNQSVKHPNSQPSKDSVGSKTKRRRNWENKDGKKNRNRVNTSTESSTQKSPDGLGKKISQVQKKFRKQENGGKFAGKKRNKLNISTETSIQTSLDSSGMKKSQKKKKKDKKQQRSKTGESLTDMISKYKSKLINKMA